MAIATTVVPLGVAVIGALGAFWAARSRLSGKIKSSEASSLWEESSAMRESYRSRAERAEEANALLLMENLRLHSEILELKRTVHKLRNGYVDPEADDAGA